MHASPFSFLQWSSHHLGRSLPALSCARLGELLIQEKWNCTFISFNMSVLSCVLIYVTATLNWILKTSLKFLLHLSFLNQCFYGRTRARTPSSWCHSVSIYIYIFLFYCQYIFDSCNYSSIDMNILSLHIMNFHWLFHCSNFVL